MQKTYFNLRQHSKNFMRIKVPWKTAPASGSSDGLDRASLGSLPPDTDPRFLNLRDYWESLRPAPGLVPSKSRFDPTKLPTLLPWIYLVEVYRKPMRFRFRLLGTGHTQALGGEHTGKFIDEVRSNFRGSLSEKQHVEVAGGMGMAYFEGQAFLSKPGGTRRFRRLLLPFAETDQIVNIILGMCFYSDLDPLWNHANEGALHSETPSSKSSADGASF